MITDDNYIDVDLLLEWLHFEKLPGLFQTTARVPVSVSHVAIGEFSKELAKPNVWILAILAQSTNIYFSQIKKCFKIIVNLK